MTFPSSAAVIDAALKILHQTPDLGRPKLLVQLKESNQWTLSLDRLKKIMTSDELVKASRKRAPPQAERMAPRPESSSPSDASGSKAPVTPSLLDRQEFKKKLMGIEAAPDNNVDLRDIMHTLMSLYNRMQTFPEFPSSWLVPADSLKNNDVSGLPPPSIPENALDSQVKYRKVSIRDLIIYGRGEYNYGISPNSNEGMFYNMVFDRFKSGGDTATPSDGMIRILWEFYEKSADKVGVSRADVGRQFEAEWGINMHLLSPPRKSDDPKIQGLIQFWEEKRAEVFKGYLYPMCQAFHKAGIHKMKQDKKGHVVWDSAKHGQFCVIVAKIDKKSGEECGVI